jgi:DNA repair exonuclease SbcCD ATPase subunit
MRQHPARTAVCGLCAEGRCDEHYIEFIEAEVERLQAEKEAQIQATIHVQRNAKAAEAEVKRLRAELADVTAAHRAAESSYDWAMGERERLRAVITGYTPQRPGANAGMPWTAGKVADEVERLRAENRETHDDWAEADNRAVLAEAEVKRLRAELDNLLDERGETPYVAEVERLRNLVGTHLGTVPGHDCKFLKEE